MKSALFSPGLSEVQHRVLVTAELQVDENLLLLFMWKQWLHRRSAETLQAVLSLPPVSHIPVGVSAHTVLPAAFCEPMTACATCAEVNHKPSLTVEVRDGLSHGQDDPEPPDYVGLDAPQKANFSVCHSQQLHHTLHAALETQSRRTNWRG